MELAPSVKRWGLSFKEYKLDLFDEIIKRLEFIIDCDYATFHPEFKRGVQESIEAVRLMKETSGTS